ncbi:hypothetical protein BpHYR1_005040 [Brachionus plicatilis]|uniref:Uncharacterized protein n=1 Tax=Brachionus plicatilis TaxID=10195 RepID=A0A3M7RGI6_BRAPC|nr:hypothetical protein BpHYR1_005040 [Brachionus plicatilis]
MDEEKENTSKWLSCEECSNWAIIYNFRDNRVNPFDPFDNHIINRGAKGEYSIQYECLQSDLCGGWADRLKGILSTYAFSLITNRKFVIKITKNCDLESILVPNKIDWKYDKSEKYQANETKVLSYRWNFNLNQVFRKEKNLFSEYKNVSLLIIKAGFMFSEPIAENVFLKSKVEKLGYNQSRFKIVYQFHNWYKELFQLNAEMQKKYEIFTKKIKPDGDTKLICAQIRMGDPGSQSELSKTVSLEFWNFIQNNFLINDNNSSRYVIYVTSDREEVKKEAKKFFTKNQVFYMDKSSDHVDLSSNCKNTANVILDFHVMQNCDIGIVSHSGFGILGLWNRPNPFENLFVYTNKNQSDLKKSYWNRRNMFFKKYTNLDDIFFT